jgi:photosystem II stability/assembly factor-like uncharacterized protein
MVAPEGLYRTTDGGQLWADVSLIGDAWRPVEGYFESGVVGWVLARSYGPDLWRTRLLRTTNGGLAWQTVTAPFPVRRAASLISEDELDSIDLLLFKDSLGIVCSRRWLMFSTNSGDSWTGFGIPSHWVHGSSGGSHFSFIDGLRGWFLNNLTHDLWRTTDGGASWDCASRDCPGEVVTFLDPKRGYSCIARYPRGRRPRPILFATEDGGATWRRVGRIVTGFSLERPQLTALPKGALFVKSLQAGIEVLMASRDGGRSWREIHRTKGVNFRQCFLNADEGWIVERREDSLAVLHTRNGGAKWEEISSINLK